ncbi:amidase [Streptomyces sp. NPDC056352]|uniref:amidase n=1 Tax=Streptomyces sp. NPDC056352 TaxID=3345791 RepID=UPI0035E38263
MRQPFSTLEAAARALRSGSISSRELVAAAHTDADLLDPLLGVYVTRFTEKSYAAAQAADALPPAERPLLHGLPLAIKDNLAACEGPVTAQSPAHDPGWWRGEDAPAVAGLRAAGAVVLGKTTMAEYAMGRPDPAHDFPVPRNPWDPERWTGGSSTGNGAGLAAGLFLGALGSDTSGSVRLPAALCGATGLKTTYGLLPLDGCLPLSASQDVLGPMAVTARDCALLLVALLDATATDVAGPTPAGVPRAREAFARAEAYGLPTCRPADLAALLAAPADAADLHGVRIGVPYELADGPGVTEGCRAAFHTALDGLRQLGAETREFALPECPGLSVVNGLTMLAEAFAAHGDRLTADWTGHGRAFRRLAAAGGLVPAHRYLRAQQLRTRLTSALRTRMSDAGIDLIATPTWPAPARPYTDEALPGAELNLTAAWNPTGFPALALPMGFESGLPLSLQLVGRPWSEPALLTAGAAYQSATIWHLRRATPDPACTPSPVPDPDRAWPPARPTPGDTPQRTSGSSPDVPEAAALAALGIAPEPPDLATITAINQGLLNVEF